MCRRPGTILLPCLWLVIAGVLMAGLLGPAPTGVAGADAPSRRDQASFMWAMAGQESGWDYFARNESSGAFGRYQIMPSNWPTWAGRYLGDPRADQTPYNQERVATGKIRDLYRWLGSWKRVAYWWLTGSSDPRERRWSAYARGYVDNIMRLRHKAPAGAGRLPIRTSSVATRGDWRVAAADQRLRSTPGGRPWSRGGTVRDGQVVQVRHKAVARRGVRWVKVVTRDGRLGWLPQPRTVPAHRPPQAARWKDVTQRAPRDDASDRRLAHPRPR